MKVEYGPPGHRGVTQLMSVGADGIDAKQELREIGLTLGEAVSLGGWIFGWITGSSTIKKASTLAGMFFVVKRIANRQKAQPEPLPEPEVVPVGFRSDGSRIMAARTRPINGQCPGGYVYVGPTKNGGDAQIAMVGYCEKVIRNQ